MLVAYYSAQGHTRAVAEAIADRLDADLFEVTPVEPYADEDLDWTDESSRMGGKPGFVAQNRFVLACVVRKELGAPADGYNTATHGLSMALQYGLDASGNLRTPS